jgi:hypothetical protein
LGQSGVEPSGTIKSGYEREFIGGETHIPKRRIEETDHTEDSFDAWVQCVRKLIDQGIEIVLRSPATEQDQDEEPKQRRAL